MRERHAILLGVSRRRAGAGRGEGLHTTSGRDDGQRRAGGGPGGAPARTAGWGRGASPCGSKGRCSIGPSTPGPVHGPDVPPRASGRAIPNARRPARHRGL